MTNHGNQTMICLSPGELSLAQLRRVVEYPDITLKLNPDAIPAIKASNDCVNNIIKEDRTAYGINTGFGLLANVKIAPEELKELQRCIVLSHAAGVGNFLSRSTVRLIMLLKINSLSRGYSGCRLEVIDLLIKMFNAKCYPRIPEKGSVGASGDLAPLSHLACVMIGEGEACIGNDEEDTKIYQGGEALKMIGCEPIVLGPKEGLALLNGTQVSTALALRGLFRAEELYIASCVVGAMSVEAAAGSHKPFDERPHAARGHKSQIDTASLFRAIFTCQTDSALHRSHTNCSKVQDPYSLRCQPQVLGACLNQIRISADVLLVEANAVSDNPLVFAEDDVIISAGNFHAEPVAFAADNLALAIAEMGSISERRSALLIDKNLSGLPAFLVDNGGVNSGFMLAQVTAAALASENKSHAHPASVDSIPTSANQEDHVSMATYGARRLQEMCQNTRDIVAVEYLSAAQGLDFRKEKSSAVIEEAKQILRAKVSFYDKDRYFAPDIKAASSLIEMGRLNNILDGYDIRERGVLPSFRLLE